MQNVVMDINTMILIDYQLLYMKRNDAVTDMYNENLSYDKNGNIMFLNRNGDMDTQIGTNTIDALVYTYPVNTNRLSGVVDNTNNSSGFIDGNKNGEDYGYDVNGNMTSDKNKNITNIQYNHLNLPKKITFGTNGTIEYIYNAAGEKLEKIVKEIAQTTYTNYLGGFQYKYGENQGNQGGGVVSPDPGDPVPDDPQDPEPPIDGYDPVPTPPVESSRSALGSQSINDVPTRPTLQFFPTAEGYFDNINQKYVYQYKDHLGNVRVSYARNPITNVLEIIDENNYYPFGLKHQGYNTDSKQVGYNYKYQGQERQDELGLNWDSFKWRNYDMAIGRFMSIDPLAENYAYNSTYAFQENKMGMGVELEGLELFSPWLEVAFSSSDVVKLSTDIGKVTDNVAKFEDHHAIPQAFKGQEVVKQGIEEGFKFDGAENKISVEKFSRATGNGRHGNHPSYNKGVLDKLGEFGKASEGSKTTEGSKTALEFLRNLSQELKETIKSNPDKKINDLFKIENIIKIDNTSVKKPVLPKPAPKPAPDPNQIMS